MISRRQTIFPSIRTLSLWMLYLGFVGSCMGLGLNSCRYAQSPKSLSSPSSAATHTRLTISAAASLQDVMAELKTVYERSSPDTAIIYNFGASGSLAQQISQSAPVDIFLSASAHWMSQLENQNHVVASSRQDFLQNTLVLVVPKQQKKLSKFEDLATPSVKRVAIGEPESVPAGQYAKELLTTLALFDQIDHKLVLGKSVRQVLAYVETENVEAGLVYETDANSSDRVRIVAHGDLRLHSKILYSMAAVEREDNKSAAVSDFMDFLLSEEAIAIFRAHGFSSPTD